MVCGFLGYFMAYHHVGMQLQGKSLFPFEYEFMVFEYANDLTRKIEKLIEIVL